MSLESPVILMIDDEALIRESVVAFLEDNGFEVLEAENGEQGLEVFKEYHPDIILCDLHMPMMGGLDLLSQLRQEEVDIPFIVVSGAGVVNDAIEALRLGAWDYILKPITDMGASRTCN